MYNQRGKGKELFTSSNMLNIFTDLVDIGGGIGIELGLGLNVLVFNFRRQFQVFQIG